MENITLGNISDILKFVATFITSSGVVCGLALAIGNKILKNALEPFNKRIDETIKINNKNYKDTIEKIKSVQLYADKNFLVRFLADVEQGNVIDEVEKERFYEVYRDYRKLGGNSYVQRKVEKLEKEGKL